MFNAMLSYLYQFHKGSCFEWQCDLKSAKNKGWELYRNDKKVSSQNKDLYILLFVTDYTATEQELEEAKAFVPDLKAPGEKEAWCKERD